ncbi:hypothetical protein ACWEBX_23890 [Streptomyces sp. NPDC005070]
MPSTGRPCPIRQGITGTTRRASLRRSGYWRLTIEEAEFLPDGGRTALAFLDGTPFSPPAEAEVHTPAAVLSAANVWVDALTVDPSGAAVVQFGAATCQLLPGSTLYSAECGLREH